MANATSLVGAGFDCLDEIPAIEADQVRDGEGDFVEIRNFQMADFESCVALFIEVFNRSPWNNRWTQESAEELFRDYINAPGFAGYVAMDKTRGNSVVGAIIGRKKTWWSGPEYYIDELFVRPDSQGKGIGTRLLEFACLDLKNKGISTVTLLTHTSVPAFDFYRKREFRENPNLRFLHKRI